MDILIIKSHIMSGNRGVCAPNFQKVKTAVAVSAIILFASAVMVTSPLTIHAQEFSFEMEESESPPKGVKQMAEEIREEEAELAAEAAQAAQQQQQAAPSQTSSTSTTGGQPSGEKAKYHGVFKALKLLDPIFPLKSGNIKASFLNLANNTGNPASFLSRENFSGGYFFESNENDLWIFKNLAGKVQYNRQLRNTLSVNSMTDLGTTLFGIDLNYNRKIRRTGGAGTQSLSDARKFSAAIKKDNGFELSFNIDQNISRTIAPTSAKTNNKKQTWKLIQPLNFREGAKFTFIHANTSNRNISGNPVSKVRQTDAKLDIPINEKFDLNLAYQLLGNRSLPLGLVSTENRRKTRSIGMTYKFDDVTKVTYLYNFSQNRNFSTTYTNFNTVNRETNFERAFSKAIKLKLGYKSTYDQAAGMTTVRTSSFSYDHKKFNILPGATSIDTRKQLNRTSTSTNTNYTLSVRTPLTYLDGKLKTNIQNVISIQKNLISFQVNNSNNQTVSTQYAISKKLALGSSYNRVKTSVTLPGAPSSRTVARVRTEKLTYMFGDWSHFTKAINSVRYVHSISRNATRNEIPTPGLTLNRVRGHSLNFGLKGGDWSGNYSFGRSLSYLYGNQTQRVLEHKLAMVMNDFFGCKLTMNYTGAFQKTGRQVSSIVKLTKKINDKRSYYLDWEVLDSKTRVAGTPNTQSRFLEMGVDLVF